MSLVARRRVAGSLVLRSVVAGTAFTILGIMPACSSLPTRNEIDSFFLDAIRRLKEIVDEKILECNGNAECIERWNAWYREMVAEALRARAESQWRLWEDAQ